MEEEKKIEQPANTEQERVYTQTEVNGIINQYNIAIEQLKKAAQDEINKRDLSNFYQTLSILFEVVKNKDAYSRDFSDKVVSLIENNILAIISEDKDKNNEEVNNEQEVR